MEERNRRTKKATGGGTDPKERASDEKKRGPAAGKGENSFVKWVKSLAIAIVLFLFIRTFLIHAFVIISGSMEDTLLVGDLLLVNRAAVGIQVPGTSWRIPGYSKRERGDILVFDPPHEEDLKLVKRLMGLPGDTLEMREKVLYVNGEAQAEPFVQHTDTRDDAHSWMTWQEEYLLPGSSNGVYTPSRDNWGPLVIPDDRYFMLGDNRDTSLDSRYWGLLEGWRLEGRAVFVYFSYDKASRRPLPWLKEIRWSRIGDFIR